MIRTKAHRAWTIGLLPFLIYVLAYVGLTFPLIEQFNSAYFCDDGDGYQTIWDLWWVREAMLRHEGSVFFTPLLHFPAGAPLWLHSLSPLNGLLSLPLSLIFPPQVSYNLLILFAFAGSGLTAFWLAWDQTHRWWPSLAAGYIFTFSSLHFAHAAGHLHQTATQFFPLYTLLMIRLFRLPGISRGLLATVTLTALLMCDPYQFLYAIMITAIWFACEIATSRRRAALRAAFILSAFSLGFCGAPLAFMIRDSLEPVAGIHNPEFFSADLLSLFVPGWTWQYHDLTRAIWEPIGKYHEKSVSMGAAAMIAALLACRHSSIPLRRWWTIAVLFSILALGPTLQVNTHVVMNGMPYRLLEMFPLFRVSGCPARMMLATQLALSVLAATGLARLGTWQVLKQSTWRMAVAALFVIGLVIETEPHVQAFVPVGVPTWVTALRDLPFQGGVLELRSGDARQLYLQTIHHRPIAFGYLSRVPLRLEQLDQQVETDFAKHDFAGLRSAGFNAIVTGVSAERLSLKLLYEDREVRIYQL